MIRSFKALVDPLSCTSGISRPNGSFSLYYLSSAQSTLTTKDIFTVNKALRYLTNNHYALKYPKLDKNFSKVDCYASLPNCSSHGWLKIFLRDDNGACAHVTLGFKQIKRVVRSTLAAETLSPVDALESSYLVLKVKHKFVFLYKELEIDIEMYIDNKSLCDAINTSNLILKKGMRV